MKKIEENLSLKDWRVLNGKKTAVKKVYEYIVECKENGVVPAVAIRVRNGQITSLIKYRKKYGKGK